MTAIYLALVSLSIADRGPLEWFLTDAFGAAMRWLAATLGVRMLEYPYMQRAYLAVVCIGIVGPLVGAFLVHREMSMIGDTLAHTAFAGVAVGLFVNSALSLSLPPLGTALLVAVVAALLVELLIERAGAHSDTSLAIVLTGGFAVGSVLITATDGGIAVGIDAYLFGSLATVSKSSVGLLLAMTVLVGGLVAAAYRPLLYVTFDETAARAAGLSVARYNRLVVVLTAFVVVSAMQILGVVLVAAMLVVPVAAAARVARTFKQSLLYGVLAAEFAGVAGVTIAYHFGVAAGGSIVLAAIAVYAATLAADSLPTPTLRSVGALDSSETNAVEADGGHEERERP